MLVFVAIVLLKAFLRMFGIGLLAQVVCTQQQPALAFLEFDSTGFDSQLIIYSGECGNLTCITGNDDNFASTTCSVTNAAV